ncbi:hypothetical protein G5714_015541 [Onychostoma macrolepis]|uniref:Ubiquitin-like protease family profile domain-containing protein n=1 Tax=Onychostoma macrolepis TaxID=369639 RepID=A0A7J6C5V7_9TELE|nr:hypothetical protein G5714_015541 [Onychostoma macrolepis]
MSDAAQKLMDRDRSSGYAADEQLDCDCGTGKTCFVKDVVDPTFKPHYGGQMIDLMRKIIATAAFMRSKGCKVSRWTCAKVPYPLQQDGTSCGVFVCKILQEFFDEAELLAYSDDGGVNNSEHNGSDSQVITLPAEETLQEDVVGTESRHEPDNVTRPSHGPSLEEGTNTSLATSPQCTGGQGVKRRRLPEEDEVDDSPSTRRLRTSENNEQDYDEEGLTAWSDSLVHASDQKRCVIHHLETERSLSVLVESETVVSPHAHRWRNLQALLL